MGAGQVARVKRGFLAGVVMALCVTVPFVVLYLGWGDGMIRLFLPADASASTTALEVGRRFLLLVSPFYLLVAAKLMGDAVLRGAGAVGFFMITTFTDLVLRVVISYLLAPLLGPTASGSPGQSAGGWPPYSPAPFISPACGNVARSSRHAGCANRMDRIHRL